MQQVEKHWFKPGGSNWIDQIDIASQMTPFDDCIIVESMANLRITHMCLQSVVQQFF